MPKSASRGPVKRCSGCLTKINAAVAAKEKSNSVASWHGQPPQEFVTMLDILMIAIILGFFALSVAYAYACDEL